MRDDLALLFLEVGLRGDFLDDDLLGDFLDSLRDDLALLFDLAPPFLGGFGRGPPPVASACHDPVPLSGLAPPPLFQYEPLNIDPFGGF